MTQKQRINRRAKGSPSYPLSNDVAITSESRWYISFDEHDKEFEHLPFDYIRIINHSNYDLLFFKNFKQKHTIKASSPYTIKREDIEGGYFIARLDGQTIEIGEVDALLQKLPIDENELAREREAKPFLKRLFEVF
ncbi:MAG: hypothetical protein OQK82_02080 [Candidatus Pacearchaeota archaeon]|nr:hypothetical protein [Candidatus Pacearchaeota archaeon]